MIIYFLLFKILKVYFLFRFLVYFRLGEDFDLFCFYLESKLTGFLKFWVIMVEGKEMKIVYWILKNFV